MDDLGRGIFFCRFGFRVWASLIKVAAPGIIGKADSRRSRVRVAKIFRFEIRNLVLQRKAIILYTPTKFKENHVKPPQ